eukprot:TRINITY_DN17103_c0_g1_i2.p1 TRINITY_DN17103_c0_g1~~TRINITY_DN17103_c0_g1_i2.p1  ORF type:complete len:276 (+),score=78.80 TRINITY_DN17103_c0_g1_i2:88-915(+)
MCKRDRPQLSRLMAPQDVACIANCLLCDSFFVVTIGEIDLASYRGKKGQKQQEALLEELQLRHEKTRHELLACPTCTLLSSGREWQDLMCDKWAEAALTPCVKVVCTEEQEDLPVYLNSTRPPGKPKWKLVQGCGPTTFEMSRAKNGCVYKRSLMDAGVAEGDVYDPEGEGMTQEEHNELIDQVGFALRACDTEEAALELYKVLAEHKPVFNRDNWELVRHLVEQLAARQVEKDRVDKEHMDRENMSAAELEQGRDWEERCAAEAESGEAFEAFM